MSRFAITLVAATLACSGAFAQTTRLKAWNIHPDGYPVTDAMKSFAAEVEKATKGRYEIELHSNGVLGDQPQAVQMLKQGQIDVAEFSLGPLSEAAPAAKALTLPFLFKNAQHMFAEIDGNLGKRYEERLKASGYVVLGWYDGGARSFYCRNKPLQQVADFQGLNIRVQNSEIYVEMVKGLGAVPKTIPYKDTLAALERGDVDCAENNLPSFISTGHYKVAKYVWLTNHVVVPEALVMSTSAWDKLSPADQQAFRLAGQNSARVMRELWNRKVDEARDIAKKAGVQFLPVENYMSLIRRMQALHGRYLSDPQTREELLSILAKGV